MVRMLQVHKSRNRARSDVTSLVSSSQATKSILTREARAKRQKKELKKSKSVRFADDESMFSEDFKSKSELDVDSGSLASRDVSELSSGGVNSLSRDEHVIATQLETMHGATWTHFSQDGSLLILSSDRCVLRR